MKLNHGYMKNLSRLVDVAPAGWFKNWFDSSFYHQLYAGRNENEAAGFVEELLLALQPAKPSRMLDLGCGAGRHAKFLATKGHQVTGIDLAASSIRQAQQYETDTLQFFRHDMRVPFGREYFDYVFNFFTSFGYFDTDAENHTVVKNMADALKPGGRVVLDYLNVHYSEQRIVAQEEQNIDGIVYRITRSSDEKHFYKKIVIDTLSAAAPLEYTERVAKLRLTDFLEMFEANGLTLQTVYGDYQLGEYRARTSPRLILVAQKQS